ncbi:MAG: sigma-E processing peptidase SpoIIGA [Clostridia bacterium]|nr:sigma-E processing peptidase SpoIIGA [Clostridia bacterium]
MYIELFLLDNMLMDMLICRLAAAMCGRRPHIPKALTFSAAGSVYAAFAHTVPRLNSLSCKILLCLIMAFALPCRGIKEYFASLVGMCAAAFIIGGSAFFWVYATGGAVNGSLIGGVSLRIMLFAASAAAAMPSIARRMRQRKIQEQNTHILTIIRNRKTYTLTAMVDSGSSLMEPVSGLPTAVAYIPGEAGSIPVPVNTVQGSGILMAFRPDRAEYGGAELDILVAISDKPMHPQALLPPAALPDVFV